MQFALGKLVWAMRACAPTCSGLHAHTITESACLDLLDSIMSPVGFISRLSYVDSAVPSAELKMQATIIVFDEFVAQITRHGDVKAPIAFG